MPPWYPSRLLLRAALGPIAAACVLFGVVGVFGVVAIQLVQAPVLPSGDVALRLVLYAVPVVGTTGGPLAVLTGFAAALLAFRRGGRWRALMASGAGALSLAPALALLATLVALATGISANGFEPAARSAARDALLEPLAPRPGRLVAFGGLALHAEHVDGDALGELFFAVEDAVGRAETGSLGDEALVLRDGEVLSGGTRVTFDELRVPLPKPSPRVELNQRSYGELGDVVMRRRLNGRSYGYAHAILLKRVAWPFGAALLILLAPPLVLGRRTVLLALTPAAYFGLVRLCDHGAPIMGGMSSAWLPVALLTLANAAAWWRWRDR